MKKKLNEEEAPPAFESHSDREGVLADLYERMRGQILSGFAGLGRTAGLGILMTQGMGAWIQRCREFTPIVADEGCHTTFAAPIPVELETQVAAIIAGMVLNHSRRELR
jgi:Na+-transporting methylmalonyl-CoA/oxaloacetate decarboxylase gamma subunit